MLDERNAYIVLVAGSGYIMFESSERSESRLKSAQFSCRILKRIAHAAGGAESNERKSEQM